MDNATSNSPTLARRYRFRQFSLRTLLGATAVVAAITAFLTWWFREPDYPIIQVSYAVVSPSEDKIAFIITRGHPRSFDRRDPYDVDTFMRYAETIDTCVAIVSLADGTVTETNTDILSSSVTWALDESRIVFVSARNDPAQQGRFLGLDSLDLQTGDVTQIARPQVWTPQFSPDGTQLGYVHDTTLVVESVQTGRRIHVQSDVVRRRWCWSPDSKRVYYIVGWLAVCEYDLESDTERVLFEAPPPASEKYPTGVACSPDGSRLGYHYDHWFHTVDLQSGEITKQFEFDSRFCCFDWNSAGICYVDSLNREQRNKDKLMVFDPNTGKSSLVATGPFGEVCWLGDSRILVRKGNTQLWAYDVTDGKGVKLFDGSPEPE